MIESIITTITDNLTIKKQTIMTNKDIIDMYWQNGNILVTSVGCNLVINNTAIGLDGFMTRESFTKTEQQCFNIIAVWALGKTPGLGLRDILNDIDNNYSNQIKWNHSRNQAIKLWERKEELPFNHCKVFVGTKSEEIQKKLFTFGYRWNDGSTNIYCVNQPFLYLDKGKITFSTISQGYKYYNECDYTEVTIDQILYHK